VNQGIGWRGRAGPTKEGGGPITMADDDVKGRESRTVARETSRGEGEAKRSPLRYGNQKKREGRGREKGLGIILITGGDGKS